jgi:glycosyl transferase family 2
MPGPRRYARAVTTGVAGSLDARSRLVAAGLVAAAVALGAAASRSRIAAGLVGAWAASIAAGAGALAMAGASSRTPHPAVAASDPRHALWVHVIVPARDEAAVIDGVLADLAAQDLVGGDGEPAFEVTVVDDRSTDGTGTAASNVIAGSRLAGHAAVIRRETGPDGKGAALAFAMTRPPSPSRVVVVLDADARIAPSFLRRAAALVAGGSPVLAARRRMGPPETGSWTARLAGLQDAEQALDLAIQRGRFRLGGASELRGDGMVVRADVLDGLGGWARGSLCEDLELSTRLFLATGRGVEPRNDLVVAEQSVGGARDLLGQRVRWAEGAIRRDLLVTLPTLGDGRVPARRRLELALGAGQLLIPWLLVGLATGVRSARGRRALAAPLASCAAAAGLLAVAGALADGARPMAAVRRLAVVAFVGHWLVALPIAWVRAIAVAGPPAYRPTRHAPHAR